MFCSLTTNATDRAIPDVQQFNTCQELLEATIRALHGAASDMSLTAEDYHNAELFS